jgi:hypothetical protein
MNPALDELRRMLDHACSAPGAMNESHRRTAARFLSGDDELHRLLGQIESGAYKITDEQVESLRARYSDDHLFEAIVAAALSSGIRRLERGLSALKGGR